jgi:hypothetical protein
MWRQRPSASEIGCRAITVPLPQPGKRSSPILIVVVRVEGFLSASQRSAEGDE